MTALRPARMNVPGNKTFKMRTLSAVIMGLCVGGQAFAETNNNNDAAAQDGTISVVTVIGEKTERSIYDTGSSVEVFDEDRLNTTAGATEVTDLLKLVPNVVDSGKGNHLPTVRGIDGSGPAIGGLASFGGTSPRINLSIDGRSLTYSELAFGPRTLWDMEQVEVYLGPQSYVQGRSASGGAIVVKSKDPTHHFESAVKGAIGQQNYSQTAAMISAPIIEDELAFRLSVDQQKRKSHEEYVSYEPVGDPRRVEMTTARGKFLYEPAGLPGFKTTFTVAYMDTRAPQSETEPTAGYNRPIYETKSTSGIWFVSYDVNENITFENNAIYTDFRYDRTTSPADRGGKNDFFTDGKEFQIEPLVRVTSDDGKLNSLYGLRYFRSSQDELFSSSFEDTPMEDSLTTTAAFAEVTYAVTPKVDVTVAGRLEKEKKTRGADVNNGRYKFNLDHDESATVFLPRLDVAYKPESNQTFGFKVAKGFNSGAAGIGFHTVDPTKPMITYSYDSETVWNYELYTRHRLNDGTLELTSNVFYNDFNDMQVMNVRPDGYIGIINISGVNTYGAEVGTRWLATSDLEFFANLGLLKTSNEDVKTGKEKELPRAPKTTASLGGLYTFADGFELSGNASYTGDYFTDLSNAEAMKIDSYWVANAQLAYVFDSGRVALFASNLFNSEKETMYLGGEKTIQPPRQIGASVELQF